MFIIRSLALLLTLLTCQFCFSTPILAAPPSFVQQAPAEPGHPLPAPLDNEQALDKPLPPLPSSEEMTDSYQSAFVRMLLSLLGLLALVFGTFWFLRRMGKGKFRSGTGRTIQVLEKRSLSPKTVLYVVEVEGKQILIAESQIEVRMLTTLETIDTKLD